MIGQFRNQQVFSLSIVRLVGYGLLLMAIIDFVILIIPPKFMNAAWELQIAGSVIERIPVTLLGIALIYYGERNDRSTIEVFLLKYLSWFCLVLAVLFFLIIPLNISNSIKIYQKQTSTVSLEITRRVDPMNKFRQQLKSANSSEQIETVLQQKTRKNLNIPNSVDANKLKNDLLKNLSEQEQKMRSQANKMNSAKLLSVLKNCIKWNLGALIAGCIFLFIWKSTLWARIEYNLD